MTATRCPPNPLVKTHYLLQVAQPLFRRPPQTLHEQRQIGAEFSGSRDGPARSRIQQPSFHPSHLAPKCYCAASP